WTPFRRAQVPQACALRPMTWPKPTSRQAKIASQRRQTADRTRGVPAVGPLVHGAAPKQDHGRSRGGVGPGEQNYLARFKTSLLCSPSGSEGRDMRRQFLKAGSVGRYKRRIIKPFGDDDVHDRQGESSVGPRPDQTSVLRTSIVMTLAPRRRAEMMCRAVFDWLAMFAPQRTIILEFSAISSLVLTLSTPVRPTPKPPSPQQIIAGCQFWQTIAGGAFPWKRSIYAMRSPVRLNFLIQRMEFLARFFIRAEVTTLSTAG